MVAINNCYHVIALLQIEHLLMVGRVSCKFVAVAVVDERVEFSQTAGGDAATCAVSAAATALQRSAAVLV